jgi:hypothetical protein
MINMREKGQKSVKVTERCHNQLKYISKGSKLTIGEFLDELVNEIFQNASSYPNGFNVNFMTSISGSYTMVQCLGKNRLLTSGKFLIPKSMTEPQKEMNCNLLEDAMTAKVVENAEKIQVEKGMSFDSVAKRMSKRAKLVKVVN